MSDAKSRTPSNVEALLAAGVIDESLPEEYHQVFEGLSEQELGMILVVKARLDGMTRRMPDQAGYQGFVAF